MKLVATALIAACLLPAARAAEPITVRLIGYYSNVRTVGTEDPHFVSGFNVVLYQHETETIGRVSVAIGSPEPAPATIKNLTYDPKKQRLTFSAEYSSGLALSPVKGVPDREALQVLTFSGVVRPQSISGKVGIKDFYCGQCRPVFKRVTLKRIADMGSPGELQSIEP